MVVLEEWMTWIRDHPPVLGLLILLGAVLAARLVDIVLCRALKRLTRRTRTQLDDRVIDLLHRPIFFSVLLLGVYFSLLPLELHPALFGGIVGLTKTIAILMWTATALRLSTALLESLSGLGQRVRWLDPRPPAYRRGGIAITEQVARLA